MSSVVTGVIPKHPVETGYSLVGCFHKYYRCNFAKAKHSGQPGGQAVYVWQLSQKHNQFLSGEGGGGGETNLIFP